jgi:hypothetical protein
LQRLVMRHCPPARAKLSDVAEECLDNADTVEQETVRTLPTLENWKAPFPRTRLSRALPTVHTFGCSARRSRPRNAHATCGHRVSTTAKATTSAAMA